MLPSVITSIGCGLLLTGLATRAESAPIQVRADHRQLTWSLFQRVDSMPDPSEDAQIAAEMKFPQPLRIASSDGSYHLPPFTITVAVEPTRTSVRRSVTLDDELLRHEQGHYDIVVLAARALARELEATTAPGAKELLHLVEARVDEHTARAKRLSQAYDRETDHGRDPAAQARWNDAISAALDSPAITRIAGLPL